MRPVSPKVSIRWIQDSGRLTPGNGAHGTGQAPERAHVLATVISKEKQGAFSMLMLDDCTDTISAKCVEPCTLSVGDLADFFALVKESEGERYLLVDFARKVTDPNFEILRKLELTQIARDAKGASGEANPPESVQAKPSSQAQPRAAPPAPSPERELKRALMALIDGSDSGMPYESILTAKLGFNEQQIENAVKDLLNRGEIYEPKIGIYKRLS